MLIDTLLGSQNFKNSSARVFAFVVPTKQRGGFAETHLYEAGKTPKTGVTKHTSGGRISAVEGLGAEFGTFNQTVYDAPTGTLLKLFVQRKRSHASLVETACQFVRLREGSAMVRLDVPLNDWAQQRVTLRRAYLEGRFELISLEEAEAQYGVSVNPIHRRYFTEIAKRDLMAVTVMADGTHTAPTIETAVIENSDGNKVAIEVKRSKRMLDV